MIRNKKSALVLACASVAVTGPTRSAMAAATWNGTSGQLWSTTANWTGQQPGGADVVFGATGAAASAGTVNNVDDTGDLTLTRSINTLWYQNRSDSGQFHTTEISSGYTLRIFGLLAGSVPVTGAALYVGTGADSGITAVTTANITGAGGTLLIDNAAADLVVTQLSLASGGVKRATLDMSGLGTFNAVMRDINVGTTGTDPLTRPVGTLYLAQTNNINCGSILVSSSRQNRTSPGASQLYLGTTNVINANSITVGGNMAPAQTLMGFKTGISGGTLQIRGAGGYGRADLSLGVQALSGGMSSSSAGVIDLTSAAGIGTGSIDAQVGTLLLGRPSNSGTAGRDGTGTLTYDAGTLDINDVTVGTNNAGDGTSAAGVSAGFGVLNVKGAAKLMVNSSFAIGRKTGSIGDGTGTFTVSGAGADARVASSIADGGGTSTITVDGAARLQSRGLTSIDTLNYNGGTLVVDLGSGGIPGSAWGTVGALNTSATNTLQLEYSGNLPSSGSFQALSFSSGASNFALASRLPARVAATLTNNANSVDINIASADQPRWNGNVNGNWDIENGAAGTANWKLVNAGGSTKYQEDLVTYSTTDKVIFDDAATGTTNVNVTTTVAPNTILVNNSSLDYTFSGIGKITGTGGIVKQGTAKLTIANSGGNDFTGGLSVQAGTVAIGADEVIPNSTGLTLVTNTTFDLTSHTETVKEVNVIGGTIAGSSGTIIGFINAQSGTVSGNVGGGSAVLANTSTLVTLSGNNSYTGVTTLKDPLTTASGVLRITSNNALGASDAASGTSITGGKDISQLELASNITTAEPITIRGRTGGASANLIASIVNHADNNAITGQISLETDGSVYTLQSDAGKLTVGDIVNVTGNTTARTLYLKGAADGEVAGMIKASSGADPVTLVKREAGTWTLSGANSYTGATTVEDGTLILQNNLTTSSNVSVTAGSLKVAHSGTNNRVIKTGAVSVAGKLDLTDNKLITTSTVADVQTLVKNGMGTLGGAGQPSWNGNGIITSEAAAQNSYLTTLAVVSNTDLGKTSFGGQVPGATDTLVMYTYGGDADLSGKIDADDYFLIDSHYGKTPAAGSQYFSGDFNYDNVVNGDDYFIIDNAYAVSQSSPFNAAAPVGGLNGVSAVPEPASIGLLALSAAGLFGRRRRNR